MKQAAVSARWSAKGKILLIGCLQLFTGCMGLTGNRTPAPTPQAYFNKPQDQPPTPEALVTYLNKNAAKVSALESRDLDIDAQQGKQSLPSLSGVLYCQKPQNFRMKAKIFGNEEADFGSNSQEFWYYIKRDNPPYLNHCSYADLERGNVNLPFPLKPDWILETLGMSAPAPMGTPEQEQARSRSLRVVMREGGKYIDLYEQTTSTQGQPVMKLTVFNNFNAYPERPAPNQLYKPQVAQHVLYDARQQPICLANVIDVQYDAANAVMVPHKVKLEWPGMQLSLTLTLREVAVNRPKTDAPDLFQRPKGYRAFDLARGTLDGAPASSILRAGANR